MVAAQGAVTLNPYPPDAQVVEVCVRMDAGMRALMTALDSALRVAECLHVQGDAQLHVIHRAPVRVRKHAQVVVQVDAMGSAQEDVVLDALKDVLEHAVDVAKHVMAAPEHVMDAPIVVKVAHLVMMLATHHATLNVAQDVLLNAEMAVKMVAIICVKIVVSSHALKHVTENVKTNALVLL